MVKTMKMLNRVLLAAAMSWSYSFTLGALFAVCTSERRSFSSLLLPGVLPVVLLGSTVIAIIVTPVAVWSVRTGTKNLCIYGPILWVVLAAYIFLVIPKTGADGPYGLIFLSVVGLIVLGLIPAPKAA
jgi:hypothetical protein